jgi:hypothetical protein
MLSRNLRGGLRSPLGIGETQEFEGSALKPEAKSLPIFEHFVQGLSYHRHYVLKESARNGPVNADKSKLYRPHLVQS